MESGLFFLPNNSRYLNGFFSQAVLTLKILSHCVLVAFVQTHIVSLHSFLVLSFTLSLYFFLCLKLSSFTYSHSFVVSQTKTYVPKLMFPTKQMKFRKAGKLYNNEFNFEAHSYAHTHTHSNITYIYLLHRLNSMKCMK